LDVSNLWTDVWIQWNNISGETMKTYEKLVEDVYAQDKELRLMALNYIVQNIEPHGDRKTLRTLQACFLAGYEAAQLVEADKWIFVDYNSPDFVRNLPLFISRVLAVSKKGKQFITSFDHENDKWDLSEHELNKNDYIVAWTQISNPKNV
jgi:hypothetical protein